MLYIFLLIFCSVIKYIFPVSVTEKLDSLSVSSGRQPLLDFVSNNYGEIQQDRYRTKDLNCYNDETHLLVSLRVLEDSRHICSGSMVTNLWILTAAHCFTSTIKPDVAYIKKPIKSQDAPSSKIPDIILKRLERHVLHSKFDPKTMANDIALVLIQRELVEFDPSIFVKIPFEPISGSIQSACGPNRFMFYSWRGLGTDVVSSKADCEYDKAVAPERCEEYFTSKDNNTFCTITSSGGNCELFVGGPLFCNDTQVGVAHWTGSCPPLKSVRFFTRVDKYLDFIQRTISNTRDNRSRYSIHLCFPILFAILFRNLP
ncbi:hypothetical protein WA026_016486 [Henosepilachna vigintioctopunctata]|uniref:trypsin n=1 Tax=Henosepilachna vigintioctopunctata TaxID=420089 RepID=A0AAW1UF26_9CUCU